MSAMSDYLENKFLDHTLSTTSMTMPTGVYIALFTMDPSDANIGTEVSGGAYARTTATFNASVSGSATTNADITFPQATGAWGVVAYFGVYDASTGGNLLLHGALSQSKDVGIGDIFKINTGNITISAD